jgi:hypothetical protein
MGIGIMMAEGKQCGQDLSGKKKNVGLFLNLASVCYLG